MTPLTNTARFDAQASTETGRGTIIRESTLTREWAETLEILSDREFMQDIERGLAEIDRGELLYTFEEVFGEPLPPDDN